MRQVWLLDHYLLPKLNVKISNPEFTRILLLYTDIYEYLYVMWVQRGTYIIDYGNIV